VLLAVVVTVGMGAYLLVAGTATGVQALSASAARQEGDCADTAILAISNHQADLSQRAYACMDATYQQRVSEPEFVSQMNQQATPNIERVARVGKYQSATGGTIVYFALEGGGESAGYIVYLDESGRVRRIE